MPAPGQPWQGHDWKRQVDLSPFQKRAQELVDSGVSWGELAERMGYVRIRRHREGHRLARALGFRQYNPGRPLQTHCTRETAEKLCEVLDMTPADAGL